MGYKSRVDWCDSTWSPVTGCLHGCEYCYARRIAERFGGFDLERVGGEYSFEDGKYILDFPLCKKTKHGKTQVAPYPFGFLPTFHRYKLDEPQHWKKPRNIFVCSMADLFGEWVPDEWIDDVIKATQRALQHRYLFLTKNPERYGEWLERFEEGRISELDEVENCWFGASASNNAELERANRSMAQWVSIEPIHEPLLPEWFVSSIGSDDGPSIEFRRWEWVVVGAETGNRKDKIIPKKEWIQEIADICLQEGTPVFMKESLRELMGDDFRQEFPWEV